MPFFTSNQLQIYYKIEGRGPRLIFLPGTASDLRQKLHVFQSSLVKQFEVLSLDPRGIGQSTSPDPHLTMKDYANDVKRLLDHIGWEKCHCVGESFGGMIAQEFALHHPQYVDRLVLAVTSSGGKGGSSFPYHEHDVSKMSPEEKADFWVQCGDTRYSLPNWKKTKQYLEQYETYLELFQLGAKNPNSVLFGERQIGARKLHDTFDRLSRLQIPTYICGGRYDHTAPIPNQLALWQQIPHARLAFFEGSHRILWQDPFVFQSIALFCIS